MRCEKGDHEFTRARVLTRLDLPMGARVCTGCNRSMDEIAAEIKGKDRCGTEVESEGWGAAFENEPKWSEKEGVWYVSNGEYASRVWFCPLCGADLEKA